MTRLTTRLSPEEMTFDPGFVGKINVSLQGRLQLRHSSPSLQACESDVLDTDSYNEIVARQECSSVYCGAGECVVTGAGAGCLCDSGFVARSFTDLDGEKSITCVPVVGTVDFSDGGNLVLPDACNGVQCGEGSCIDVGGFPSCSCGPGSAAVAKQDSDVPQCATVTKSTGSRGAGNYSASLTELAVCAPAPPDCGDKGWLVPNTNKNIQGVLCSHSVPDEADTIPLPAPVCGAEDEMVVGGGNGGCGCALAGERDDNAALALLLMSAVGVALVRRRRRELG